MKKNKMLVECFISNVSSQQSSYYLRTDSEKNYKTRPARETAKTNSDIRDNEK